MLLWVKRGACRFFLEFRMNNKLLKICLLAGLAVGLNSCSEGEYNDLNCDPATYKAECLDTANFMFCNNGTLTVIVKK